MRSLAYCSIALLVCGVAVAAEQFDDVQIDNKTCNLVRAGTDNRDVVFPGNNRTGMCIVAVPAETFNHTYSSCSLSGVVAIHGHVLCQFGYYDTKHEQMSFVSDRDNTCQFTCLKR